MRRALLAMLSVLVLASPAWPYGFGAFGLEFGPFSIYTVTHTGNTGTGSLRTALSVPGREVRFATSGPFNPSGNISIASHIYLNGCSAPGGAVTINGRGFLVVGQSHVVLHCVRVRNAIGDGLSIQQNAHHVLLVQSSIAGSLDGAVDITAGAHHVTIADSLLVGDAAQGKVSLINTGAHSVTVVRSLLVGTQRLPQVRDDQHDGPLTGDVRNNILIYHGAPGFGVQPNVGSWSNVVGNLFVGPQAKDAIKIDASAFVHVSGNLVYRGTGCLPAGNVGPFAIPPTATTDAVTAAIGVVAHAGAQPLDATDQAWWAWANGYVASLPLPTC